jgi:hypothetical protein
MVLECVFRFFVVWVFREGKMEELIPIVKDKINSLIKKPNMSEKLLMKPPFRFLHDTISAIIQTTGFAEGLYSADEMDSATINEKNAKIDYLDKIFGVVGICHVSPRLIPRLTYIRAHLLMSKQQKLLQD